jgi:diacylglycerol kinase family enzyme
LTSQNGEGTANSGTNLKPEEIIFVLEASKDATGEYLIYSLSEGSISEGDKPFSLEVVRCQHQQLPKDLSEFVVVEANIPPPHLRLPRNVHVVVSTRSGLRLAQGFYQDVLRPLLGAVGLEPRGAGEEGYELTVTKNSNTIRDFARGLGKDGDAGKKTVILLSGDGGVVDMLNGLDHASSPSDAPSPPTIGLLPLGTGNALFHSLHKPHYSSTNPHPSPLVLALRTLFKVTPAELPTFRASFSPGAKLISAPLDPEHVDATLTTTKDHEKETPVTHLLGAIVASYGFHASLVWESDTPAYREHGDKRFGMAAAELLKVAHAYDAVVEVRRKGEEGWTRLRSKSADHGDGDGRFNYVLTTLVSNLEKTFTISPAGRPLDGQLRLVHFGDVGGDKTMEIMMAAYRDGEHVGMPEVGYEEVEEVRVTIAEEDPRWRKVCIDGSIVEVEKGGWMQVGREETARLRILT